MLETVDFPPLRPVARRESYPSPETPTIPDSADSQSHTYINSTHTILLLLLLLYLVVSPYLSPAPYIYIYVVWMIQQAVHCTAINVPSQFGLLARRLAEAAIVLTRDIRPPFDGF